MQVDAVDINPMFNAIVRRQAEFYDAPLQAIHGSFGDTPRPGEQYDAVSFHEAFHHCSDPIGLIRKLRGLVKSSVLVLMAGEPIGNDNQIVPYPWGSRLDAESLAVTRWRHWFEIGFQESYLVNALIADGVVWDSHRCALTPYGDVHAFRPRPDRIDLGRYSIPGAEHAGWSVQEVAGR